MRNEGHFGQFKTFSKKAKIFEWNVLRSTMFQVFLEKYIKCQMKKWINKKVFIFYFWKVPKLNFADKWPLLVKIDRNFYFQSSLIFYEPFESPNRGDSKYVVLENVWIDLMQKTSIHIRTIQKPRFRAYNSWMF